MTVSPAAKFADNARYLTCRTDPSMLALPFVEIFLIPGSMATYSHGSSVRRTRSNAGTHIICTTVLAEPGWANLPPHGDDEAWAKPLNRHGKTDVPVQPGHCKPEHGRCPDSGGIGFNSSPKD